MVLSVLLLGTGVAGTAGLSALSEQRRVASAALPAQVRPRLPVRAPSIPPPRKLAPSAHAGRQSESIASSSLASRAAPVALEAALADAAPVSLQPLQTPMRAMPYRQLRAHRGSLVLKVGIDGDGRVRRAALSDSSGDAVLDEYALSSVHAWRFLVPAGHAAGLDGEVTLRFTGADEQLAERR
jgi:protein TonB